MSFGIGGAGGGMNAQTAFTVLTGGNSVGTMLSKALSSDGKPGALGKLAGMAIDLAGGNPLGALAQAFGGGSMPAGQSVASPSSMLAGGLLGGALGGGAGFGTGMAMGAMGATALGGAGALGLGGVAAAGIGGLAAGGLAGGALGGGLLGGALGGGSLLGGLGKMMGGAMGLATKLITPSQENSMRNAMGASYVNGGPGSAVNRLPPNACFEDLVAALMMDVVKDMQRQVRAKLTQISKTSDDNSNKQSVKDGVKTGVGEAGAAAVRKGAGDTAGDVAQGQINGNNEKGTESRDLMMEELKMMMQKLSAMQQAMSNVYNTMHENAMNPIRNIKA